MKKFKPLYIASRTAKWCSHCGKQYSRSSKNTEFSHDTILPCLGIYPQKTETGTQRYLNYHVHSSSTENSQKMETTQMFTMSKCDTHKGITVQP